MDILQLANILKNHPELQSLFNYDTVNRYFEVINLLKPNLSSYLASYQHGPPPHLPTNIHEFLKIAFSMSDEIGKLAWEELREYAWNTPFKSKEDELAARTRHMKIFLQHGLPHNIGRYFSVDNWCTNLL